MWWLAPWLVYIFASDHALTPVMILWSCVPWVVAVFDAITYLQTSRLTFNLTYNIEDVLNRLPPDENLPIVDDDRFSMDVSQDSEDDDDLIGVSSPVFEERAHRRAGYNLPGGTD